MQRDDAADWFTAHWRLCLVLIWLGAAILFVWDRWAFIHWFALGDTDDNMRMMQVRALLHGQGWYDLRQYRLDPPYGANIHWSRLVDLPIAGLILALRPFVGGAMAEKVAVTIAPMLPMAVAIGAIAVIARRTLSPKAFALGVALLFCAHSTRLMWIPLRIDHHGWQLAMLSLVMASLVDRKPLRAGLMLGGASVLSLTIGLEMLPYLAAGGGVSVLMWVRDRSQTPRIAAYGVVLAGGCALSYLLFTSWDNSAPVCDALSPVWLSAMLGAGALSVLLALVNPDSGVKRFALAAAGGIILAAALAWSWPHCIGRLEAVSPELDRLWLSKVREALPVYRHPLASVVTIVALPLIGLVGYAMMLWRTRRDEAALTQWAALAAVALLAAGLLLWQTRAGPAAQLLAVPGATALAWFAILRIQASGNFAVRVVGTVAAFLVISGIGAQYAAKLVPDKEAKNPRMKAVNRANRLCPTLAALRPVALQPKGYVLTFVDLGPRLITVTHHDAVAGPYHRNQQAILDVMHAFRGSADNAHRIIERRGIDYVLICPGLSESTIYRAEAPKGFYVQLAGGKVPDWLAPVPLPKNSPYKMWRVTSGESSR